MSFSEYPFTSKPSSCSSKRELLSESDELDLSTRMGACAIGANKACVAKLADPGGGTREDVRFTDSDLFCNGYPQGATGCLVSTNSQRLYQPGAAFTAAPLTLVEVASSQQLSPMSHDPSNSMNPYGHSRARSSVISGDIRPIMSHVRSNSASTNGIERKLVRIGPNPVYSAALPKSRSLSSGMYDYGNSIDIWNTPMAGSNKAYLSSPFISGRSIWQPLTGGPAGHKSQNSVNSIGSPVALSKCGAYTGFDSSSTAPSSIGHESAQSDSRNHGLGVIGVGSREDSKSYELFSFNDADSIKDSWQSCEPITPPQEKATLEESILPIPKTTKPAAANTAATPGEKTLKSPSNVGQPTSETNTQSDDRKRQFDLSSPRQIYALCKDQRGCRFLQRKLQERETHTVKRIFSATCPHMVVLMTDLFGNYFCQKLVETCSDRQITQILKTIQPNIVTIALSQHGTRALQKLVSVLRTKEQIDLLRSALSTNVVRLVKDINGNHVIQKILVEFDDVNSQFVYDAVSAAVVDISSHRHGCCVLQRCIDHANERNRKRLVNEVLIHARTLVCDPFGNYVCQYVIDLDPKNSTSFIGGQLLGNIPAYSMQKFSSNVIEKCLVMANADLRNQMIQEILESGSLQKLLHDSYGNYVIQTALDVAEGSTRKNLVNAIHGKMSRSHSLHGRRIMTKLKNASQTAAHSI